MNKKLLSRSIKVAALLSVGVLSVFAANTALASKISKNSIKARVAKNGSTSNSMLDFEVFMKNNDIIDGTAPFDSNNEAGYDSNKSNKIVRSFDSVSYPVKVTVNPKKDQTLRNIKLKLTGSLINGVTVNNGTKHVNASFAVGNTTDLVKNTVTFSQEYTMDKTGSSIMIPVTVEVKGAENGTKLTPKFKVAVESVDGKDVTNDDLKVELNDVAPVTVSSKVHVRSFLSTSWTGSGISYVKYDAYVPKSKDNGYIQPYTVALAITPIAGHSDNKGSAFPAGKVSFDTEFKGYVAWDQGGTQPLDFKGRDKPITIFDYQNIDWNTNKIGNKNTESENIGSYYDPRPMTFHVSASKMPDLSQNTINNYYWRSVWDSGKYSVDKPIVTNGNVVYHSSNTGFVIGSTFPTHRASETNPNGGLITVNQDTKVFSTQRFLVHTPNQYLPLAENNKQNKANNVFYDIYIRMKSYKDSHGNEIPLDDVAKTSISERNNPAGAYSLQTTFHTKDGKELGTPNLGYNIVSRGDATITRGADIKVVQDTNVRKITEGGIVNVTKWNTDSFEMTRDYAKTVLNYPFSYKDDHGNYITDRKTITPYLGVAKNEDNSFYAITHKGQEDFNWYKSYDEAIKHGKIAALKTDFHAVIGIGETVARNTPLHVITNKTGSINEHGTPNITATTAYAYQDKDRKTFVQIRKDGNYNNYSEYDDQGKLAKIQTPIGSTVNFDTLGIMNAEMSSSIKSDKDTYYSSEQQKWNISSSLRIPETTDMNSVDGSVTIKQVLGKGLVYKANSGYLGTNHTEPTITHNSDGTTNLNWKYTLTQKNKTIPNIKFDTTINPLELEGDALSSLEVKNIISSSLDTRDEKFRTSSKSIGVIKIGMVGVMQSINKDSGEKNSEYTIGVRPYTTVESEDSVKGIVQVPQNNDAVGSHFTGTNQLKAIDVQSNKEVNIWTNTNKVSETDPNKIDLKQNGWIAFKKGDRLDNVKSICYEITGSLSKADNVLLNLTFMTKGNSFGDEYFSESTLNSATHYKLPPLSNRVKYLIRANVELELKQIRIFTDRAKKGLPVTVMVDSNVIKHSNINGNVKVNLYEKDTNKLIDSKIFDSEKVPNEIKYVIPSNGLAIDTHKGYIAKIEGYNDNSVTALKDKNSIDTDGYTASELHLNANSSSNSELNYKGVVMTQRTIGQPMELYYETLNVPVNKISKTKSGYGVTFNNKLTYQNDLLTKTPTAIKTQTVANRNLVESSLNYPEKNGKVTIPMTETKENATINSVTQTFALPKAYVESQTGNVFSESQKQLGDKHISHSLIDGGNKLYIPIWINKLGVYDVDFQNTDLVGVNCVSFDVSTQINVYAYMYATQKSDTVKQDELLLEPVYPDSQKPKGFSSLDNTWLKK